MNLSSLAINIELSREHVEKIIKEAVKKEMGFDVFTIQFKVEEEHDYTGRFQGHKFVKAVVNLKQGHNNALR